MGGALVRGIIRNGLVPPERIMVADADEARRRAFAQEWSVTEGTNDEVAAASDVLLVAVKPDQIVDVLGAVGPRLREGALVISVAAGVPLARLEGALGRSLPVIRAMPNTPCLVGEGAIAISLGRWAGPEHQERAVALFGAVGQVVTVPESKMDAVTGLSGSGPAYVFTVIQALIDGGVAAGLDRETARRLAVHTVLGSARLVIETERHPVALRDMVMSPGGTTAAGIAVLERRAVPAAFIDAVLEASRRSAELGQQATAAGSQGPTGRPEGDGAAREERA